MVNIDQVPSFYQNYIRQVGEQELVPLLQSSGLQLVELLRTLSDEQAMLRYAPGKWSIKDLIQHLSDSERVFNYRALRFSRNDSTELPGFEQDDYVKHADADALTLKQLLVEFQNVRASTVNFFEGMTPEMLSRTGVSNGSEMSVEMIGFIISGHLLHHISVIKERYLS